MCTWEITRCKDTLTLYGFNVYLLQARGVDDVGNLPKYPFRDDGRLLFTAIQDCVHEYVEL